MSEAQAASAEAAAAPAAPVKNTRTFVGRIVSDKRAMTRAQTYRKIEQAVWKQALPMITPPDLSLKHRLEVLRHEHERVLTRLIEKAKLV